MTCNDLVPRGPLVFESLSCVVPRCWYLDVNTSLYMISCISQTGRSCSWNQATWRLAGQLTIIDNSPPSYIWFLCMTKKHEIDGDPRDWSSGLSRSSVIFKNILSQHVCSSTPFQFCTHVHSLRTRGNWVELHIVFHDAGGSWRSGLLQQEEQQPWSGAVLCKDVC